ncbi:MAG: ATP-dependent DNA ligase [Candidatus Brocadiales bacterium]
MERFCATCEAIGQTTKKLKKTATLAQYLSGLDDESLKLAAVFFTGRPFPLRDPRVLGLGYGAIRDVVLKLASIDEDSYWQTYLKAGDSGDTALELLQDKTSPAGLTLRDVKNAFETIAGIQGAKGKAEALEELLRKASPVEAKYIARIIESEMRIGLKESLVEESIARAFGYRLKEISLANMLCGDVGEVAFLARHHRLNEVKMRPLRPLKFMLASPVETSKEVFQAIPAEVYVEDKYDGIRAQIHKEGTDIRIFSRTLDDITERFPELIPPARSIGADFIIDGEIIGFKGGEVMPFTVLQTRLGRKAVAKVLVAEVPVVFIAFDILYLNGDNLTESSLRERRGLLERLGLSGVLRPSFHAVAHAPEDVDRLFNDAIGRKNEGLMLKDPNSEYIPGKRGMSWLKLKKAFATLDVVITAAEYGHGKRKGLLSDYTFAVRDGERLVNIGKAYSGLKDEEIKYLTEFFLKHTFKDLGSLRTVEPTVVIEVAFQGIQKSQRHESGYALRFARIKRIRDDKKAGEIDNLEYVKKLYESQKSR